MQSKQQPESPFEKLNPIGLKECIQRRTGEPAALQHDSEHAAYGFRVANKGSRTCFIRFFGPPGEEKEKLNKYANALRQDGFDVEFKNENSLNPNSAKRQREQIRRRNREFLVVKKRKKIIRGSHAR